MALLALEYTETLMFKAALSWSEFLSVIAQPLLLEKLLSTQPRTLMINSWLKR